MNSLKTLTSLFVSTSIFSVALYFIRTTEYYQSSINDQAAWSAYFSVFGIVYAIMSGFLLVEVLQKFSNLSSIIEEEVNALQDIRDFLIYFDTEQVEKKEKVKKAIGEYAYVVGTYEWKQMANKKQNVEADTSEELYSIMNAVDELEVINDSDRLALMEFIRTLSVITTKRTQRITLANSNLPTRLYRLILFMSICLCIGFLGLYTTSLFTHYFITLSVVMAVHILFLVIKDLDTPFSGVWKLDEEGFVNLSKKIL